ncbi:MAG: two-component regulator propeller domain-containing protein [Bacteroidota bacterium]
MRSISWARPHPAFFAHGLIALCCFLLLGIEAQGNSIPYRLYTISDGLSHENIQTLEQTPDGRLWVGTSAGLSFYTGAGFVPVRFIDATSTVNILEIEPLENDDVWVATRQMGIWHVRYQHAVQPFPELADIKASRILARNDSLYIYAQEEVWQISLTDNVLLQRDYRFEPSGIDHSVAGALIPNIVSADIAADGGQWVLDHARGPGRLLSDGSIRFLEDKIREGWYALRFDEAGTAWVSHQQEGLFRFNPETGELEQVLAEAGLRHICITPKMIVVSSYNHGALFWNLMKDGLMMSMSEESGLPTNRVNCIYRDHEGNAWIGTQIGLVQISHLGVMHIMEVQDRPLLSLNAVYNHRDQSVWASSDSEGLFQLHPMRKSVLPAGENRWSDLFKGADGRMHALGGSGWFTYGNDGEWAQREAYAGGYHGDVDRKGNGYFWHADGIYKHRAGKTPSPMFRWPLEEQDFHRQTLTADGELVIWANGQVLKIDTRRSSRQINAYPATLVRNVANYRNTSVNDIVVDHLGRTWVALLSSGLLCVEADTTMQLLPDYHIEKLSLEGDSLLIANAREGLFVFNLPSGGKAKGQRDGKASRDADMPEEHLKKDAAIRYHLTQSDGLMSTTVSGAAFTKQFLWVTHPGGITQIPRRLLSREAPIPQVLLTSINYNGVSRSQYKDVVLKASDTNIGFEFSATTFSHPHQVEYRYRLNGLPESDWVSTKKPSVHFASLPAGSYEFEVQATTSRESYGESISYNFEIPVPYYHRPMFWMTIIVIMMVLSYYLHLYRLRLMLQVERTRTQIAMDLHDDIGSSLTSLSFMSNLAYQRTQEKSPKEEISPILQEIGSMSSELVDNMLDIVWSVDPKQDSVGSVIQRLQAFYQRVNDASDITVNWKVEDGVRKIALPPRSRRNLYLIIKEAINNAIKHSSAERIDIAMTQDLVVLHVVIQDYGKGFDTDAVEKGYGLTTMRDRAKESGATFELRAAVGSATTVYLKWPLRKYAS